MGAIKEFFVHFGACMKKNWLISIRGIKATLGQLLAPVIFGLLIFGLQNIQFGSDTNPPVQSFGPIPKCTVGEGTCFSLLYTYNGTDPWNNTNFWITDSNVDSIMSMVAAKNGMTLRTSFDENANDGESVIMKVPDLATLEQFVIDNPNRTQAAIIFSPDVRTVGYPWHLYPSFAAYSIMYNLTAEWASSVYESVQLSLDRAIMSTLLGEDFEPDVTWRNYPEYTEGNWDAVGQFGALFFYCALMFNFNIFLYHLTNEKAEKLRLGMRMFGLSDVAYWLSWFLTNVIFVFLYTIILMIVGYATGLAFFARTDGFVIFLTFFIFGLTMTPLAMFVGMFLTATRQAITAGMLIFVLGTVAQIVFGVREILFILYWEDFAPPEIRIVLQFWPPFNFSKMISDISLKASEEEAAKLDAQGNSSLLFTWDDLYKETDYGAFSIPPAVDSIGYQFICFGIFTVLSWYLYNVMPSEKGNSPWFFLTRNYWGLCGAPPVVINEDDHHTDLSADDDVNTEAKKAWSSDAEVRILDLHKRFIKIGSLDNKGFGIHKIKAVNGVSMSLHSGQVFALLGHNGAGKTTTINVLTGVEKSSSGDAVIYGKSVKHSLPDVLKLIGVCPQHNILWPELTAREHLEIFALIKLVPADERKKMIDDRLSDVLLLDVANKKAGEYSGGMKRRLSVAISAIGDPKVIYLDEPTTGLDPMSRREIWGAIQRLKKNRVVILTSHSMEEADILGDRIGVMAHGKLRCVGTSLHLKNKFGLGYRLNLVARDERMVSQLKDLVNQMLTGSELIAESGASLVYGIKTDILEKIIPFFEYIEQNIDDKEFVIKDWGISQTTLEEVFLKVTHTTGENHFA